MDRLAGKLALITRGGAGLGAAIARRFAGEGAELVVNDVVAQAAAAVAEETGGALSSPTFPTRPPFAACSA